MKVTSRLENDRRTYWKFETTGKWDSRPLIDEFQFDHSPSTVHKDRVAVAQTLIFGNHFGGRVDFAENVDLVVAQAIEDFLRPARVQVASVHDGPTKNPEGTTYLHLGVEVSASKWEQLEQDERELIVLPATDFTGSLHGVRTTFISSNAFLFRDHVGRFGCAELAMGVIFAETMFADCLIVPDDFQLVEQARHLLRSVSLRLLTETQFLRLRSDVVEKPEA